MTIHTPALEWEGIIFIQGPGIDEYIDRVRRILILDEFYNEMYADYVFLGPEVLGEAIDPSYPDIVGLVNAIALLEPDGTLVVCGDDPRPCTTLLAALLLARRGERTESIVTMAWEMLRTVYTTRYYKPRKDRLSYPGYYIDVLKAYKNLLRLLDKRLPLLFSLAMNYEYGLGRRAYSELVTWASATSASDNVLAAALFSFLALSRHGSPKEILRYRFEVVKPSEISEVFGETAVHGIETLREYAEGSYTSDSAFFDLLVSMKPGEGKVLHLRKEEELIVYCRAEEDVPDKTCVETVKRTVERLSSLLPEWARRPKIEVGPPRGLLLTPPQESIA